MKHFKSAMSRREWTLFAKVRDKYLNREISHAEYILRKNMLLEGGSMTNGAMAFEPYFIALSLGRYDKLTALIEDGKEMVKRARLFHRNDKEQFHGKEYVWELFRPHDENYCCVDGTTYKCVLPWKLSDEEESEFREENYIHFVDPYCDGRDCTGAPFTS